MGINVIEHSLDIESERSQLRSQEDIESTDDGNQLQMFCVSLTCLVNYNWGRYARRKENMVDYWKLFTRL